MEYSWLYTLGLMRLRNLPWAAVITCLESREIPTKLWSENIQEGVVIDATIILKCLAGAEHYNDYTDLLKYQREVPLLTSLVS